MMPTLAPDRSFLDWPFDPDPAGCQADVAVLGVTHSEPYAGDEQPNDQTRAPAAIRAQSGQFGFGGGRHHDFDFGAALGERLPPRCVDLGDAVRGAEPFDAYYARVAGYYTALFGRGVQVLTLGGDHGVTIPALDGLAAAGTRLHIVHVDAHLDWREEVGGVRRGYSSPLRHASTCPWVAGMTQIGLRGTGSARPAEVADALRYGSRLVTATEVHEHGMAPVEASIPDHLPLYITIDADGLDPSVMPGVMGPAPGGLSYAQVAGLVMALARRQPVLGMDIVEVAPRYDATNAITCITAGRLLVALLGAQGPLATAASRRAATP